MRPPLVLTHRVALLLATAAAVACSASAGSRAHQRATGPSLTADTVALRPAGVDLSGEWTTGSIGEPAVKRIVLRPQCNYHPALWVIEQHGDSVRAWTFPESHDQGIATARAVSHVPAEGRVSGLDLTMGAGATRYVLHYDSTSGHLRGAVNGAPFWAVRVDVVRPEGCLPPP